MKSHVSLEQKVCIITGTTYETESILLDKRMQASMEKHTVTGFGICPEASEQLDKGFIALVEIDPNKSEKPFKPDTVWRTGKVVYLRKEVAAEMFNADVFKIPLIYVEDGVIEQLIEEANEEPS